MKKLLTFLLLVLYTLSSVGASVSTHYCMGKIRKCQCAKPKEGAKDHCCKNTVQFVKTQEAHAVQFASEIKKSVSFESAIPSPFLLSKVDQFAQLYEPVRYYISSSTAPPIYQFVCNYRI